MTPTLAFSIANLVVICIALVFQVALLRRLLRLERAA
jgi:hypothetical protein